MTVEYYTPKHIIDVVTEFFNGQIDLDVASCEKANRIVDAGEYYTIEDNALDKAWVGFSIWMNHPYGRGQNDLWVDKLIQEYEYGHFAEALCLTNVSTSTKYCQKLLHYPTVFFDHRIKFVGSDGQIQSSPRYDNMITYLGSCDFDRRFEKLFSQFGTVKL